MSDRVDQVAIRPYRSSDAGRLTVARIRNRDFLQPYEPLRSEGFFTAEGQREWIGHTLEDARFDHAYAFGVFDPETGAVLGHVALSNVSRGGWQNATIGYWVDQGHNGMGLATSAVRFAVAFAFDEVRLHRVQGAVMPRNIASVRVLTKNGFRHEGSALRYLQINGVWEDHDIYAITKEDLERI